MNKPKIVIITDNISETLRNRRAELDKEQDELIDDINDLAAFIEKKKAQLDEMIARYNKMNDTIKDICEIIGTEGYVE